LARLFFAVEVPPDLAEALRIVQAKLERHFAAPAFKMVRPEQAHCTLRFLGELSAERQIAAARAGQAAAVRASPFDFAVETLGVFPDDRRAHTLWIGAAAGANELIALAASLDASLADEGFAPEARPFVPHLTLARIKSRIAAATLRALLQDEHATAGALRVESFSLMESRSGKDGVEYVRRATFRLERPCMPSR
jgi:2'-5' RNA ligase